MKLDINEINQILVSLSNFFWSLAELYKLLHPHPHPSPPILNPGFVPVCLVNLYHLPAQGYFYQMPL